MSSPHEGNDGLNAQREKRREQLRREIQVGLDENARGESAPLDMAEIKRKARARWEAKQRQ
jgi:hypothetical protein